MTLEQIRAGWDALAARPTWQWLTLSTAIVVGLHIALSGPMAGPTITDDELGFLANARVLAGGEAAPIQFGFSPTKYAGYSLFLVPLYWLGLDPLSVFRGALVVNAVLGGLVLLTAYALARQVWGTPRAASLVTALVASLYPAVLLNASFAWSETLLFVLVMLVALCAYRLVSRPDLLNSAAFSVCGGILYFSHPRLVGITALCGVFLVALTLRRRLAPSLLAFSLGVLGAIVVGTRALHGWLLPQIYGADSAAFADDRAGFYLDVLRTPALLKEALLGAVGTGWYLGAASLGLALVGFGALAWLASGRHGGESVSAARRWHAGFVCAGILILVAVSSMSLAGAGDRVDYRFYGRYAEAFGPLLVVSSLCFLHTYIHRRRALLSALTAGGAATVALGLIMFIGNGPERFQDVPTQGVTILGVLAQAGAAFPLDPGFPVWRTTVVAIVALGVLTAIAMRSRMVAVGGLCVLFVGSAILAQERYVTPLSEAIQRTTLLHRSTALQQAGGVSYDIAAHAQVGALTLPLNQFYLPSVQFRLFDSEAGELPPDDFVIAKAGWPDAQGLGAKAVARETIGDQTLWVLPGEAADALARSGALLPDPGASVGPDAMLSDIRLDLAPGRSLNLCAGTVTPVRGVVRHRGKARAWPQPALSESGPIPGRVYLVQEWREIGSGNPVTPQRWAGELPYALPPGESAPVEFHVDTNTADAVPLATGRYTLRLGLHQEGFGSFWEAGHDQPLDLEAVVRNCGREP